MNYKFNERLSNTSPEILQKISEIDNLKSQWASGASLDPQILGRLKNLDCSLGLGLGNPVTNVYTSHQQSSHKSNFQQSPSNSDPYHASNVQCDSDW
jgi:hypothetical protein